eukprot:14665706-Ditylum_brightwellii.AAC.1
MKKEVDVLQKRNTWTLLPMFKLPKNVKVIPTTYFLLRPEKWKAPSVVPALHTCVISLPSLYVPASTRPPAMTSI